jgi:tetratricopeptide (TPR) repeat protein
VAQPQPPAGAGQGGPADGARLNDEGFALMRQGQYQEAIPVLERAVRAFPAGSQDTTYAYALYNLGASLRRAGRAGEAIPVLERRLQFPNQRDVVQRELDLARRDAGG